MKFKVVYFGNKDYTAELKEFETVEKDPDFILSIGGDGTLLSAEREFPGIPKIIYRESASCHQCSDLSLEQILKRIKNNEYQIQKWRKLEMSFKGKKYRAFNDFVVRNHNPLQALRFKVKINNYDLKDRTLVGDGIVISSAFGSFGYFKSITRTVFTHGMGIAFNNITGSQEHVVAPPNSIIEINVERGEGIIGIDNDNKNLMSIKPKDKCTVTGSLEYANLVSFGDTYHGNLYSD